jgi:hypothetical protein
LPAYRDSPKPVFENLKINPVKCLPDDRKKIDEFKTHSCLWHELCHLPGISQGEEPV